MVDFQLVNLLQGCRGGCRSKIPYPDGTNWASLIYNNNYTKNAFISILQFSAYSTMLCDHFEPKFAGDCQSW